MTQQTTTYLKDYTPPPFLVDEVGLHFDIRDDHTLVQARLELRRNPAAATDSALYLNGEALELLELRLDGRLLAEADYALDAHGLTLAGLPARCVLETTVRIRPDANTQLSGLYRSGTGYFTQCEAEGFRRITYFPDRPDVMARYTVSIEADRARCPVLLSDGNLVEAVIDRLDPINAQVAARIARAFDRWRHYDTGRQAHARAALEALAAKQDLSINTRAVVEKALA